MMSVAFFNSHADCHYAECRYAECCYAECRYAECCSTNILAKALEVAAARILIRTVFEINKAFFLRL
jgi:hypothetical protein